MTAEQSALEIKATEFADKLTALTRGVLCGDFPEFFAVNLGDRIQVAPLVDGKVARIPVSIDGEACLSLNIQHSCWWDGMQQYLAVVEAKVHVLFDRQTEPLFRYEYERDGDDPPGAHLHVHAARDEIAYLLRLSEGGKPRTKLRQRKVPRLAEIHWSVGGHRLRPALEDVLLLLRREFRIDVQPNWRAVLDEHLREFRIVQLKAAVRDAHADAADILREIGYVVEATERVTPQRPNSRLLRP